MSIGGEPPSGEEAAKLMTEDVEKQTDDDAAARRGSLTEPVRNLDSSWIESVLPHRYPMLMVDRVLELVPDESIVAIKNVTVNEPFFRGHFPQKPVMPGVLIIEALAQAAGLLLLYTRPELHGRVIYFVGIEKARFRRPTLPGDQLSLEVEILRARRNHARFSCRAVVDGEVNVQCIASSMLGQETI